MPTRFEDLRIDREGRLSLGIDRETGSHFLSIPVANTMVDYEEFYKLSDDEFRRFEAAQGDARAFAEACRARRHDDRLILEPGGDRGSPS